MADLLHTSQHFHRKLYIDVAIVTRFVILKKQIFYEDTGVGHGVILSHFLTFDIQSMNASDWMIEIITTNVV